MERNEYSGAKVGMVGAKHLENQGFSSPTEGGCLRPLWVTVTRVFLEGVSSVPLNDQGSQFGKWSGECVWELLLKRKFSVFDSCSLLLPVPREMTGGTP